MASKSSTSRVDGVKPPQDAASAQVQEVRFVVVKNEAPPRARGAPSTRRSRGPSQVFKQPCGPLEVAAGPFYTLLARSVLLAALRRFTRG